MVDTTSLARACQCLMVTVYVGPEHQEFNVQADLLRSHSVFFKSVLRRDKKGSLRNTISLKEANVQAFKILLHWTLLDEFPKSMNFRTGDDFKLIGAVYFLADYLIMTKAKNDLVDHLIRSLDNEELGMNFDSLRGICEGGGGETRLFQFCVDSCVRRLMLSGVSGVEVPGLNEKLLDHPHLMFEVLKSIAKWKRQPWGNLTMKRRCYYHDHRGEKCK